jgi:hypothetical protein
MNSPWIDPPEPLRAAASRMPYAGGLAWTIALLALAIGGFMIAVGPARSPFRIWVAARFGRSPRSERSP